MVAVLFPWFRSGSQIHDVFPCFMVRYCSVSMDTSILSGDGGLGPVFVVTLRCGCRGYGRRDDRRPEPVSRAHGLIVCRWLMASADSEARVDELDCRGGPSGTGARRPTLVSDTPPPQPPVGNDPAEIVSMLYMSK